MKNISLLLLLSAILVLSGCAGIISKLTQPNFATKFKSNEVPNTLMRKPVAEGRLTSKFGFRLSPSGIPFPKKHKGIDYAAPEGTPIYASGNGVINKKYVSKSYGNYVRIKHANGFSSAYAHMQKFADSISEGSSVKRGQVIGAIGTTGRSTGAHLHYELHYRGKPVDPLFKQ
jgi:murein DD-endopeptidase MepM/ murein hydrolase activator NlpD